MPESDFVVGGPEFSGYHSSCRALDGPENERDAFEQLEQPFGENEVVLIYPPLFM